MNATRKLPWFLALLAVLVLAMVAAGCGGDDDEGEAGGGGDTGATETSTLGGEDFKVGLVTDIGGLNDRGFNSLANQGLENAAADLGVRHACSCRSRTPTTSPTSPPSLEDGYDLVISVGFLMGEATHQAAEEYPDTNFAIVDFAYGGDGCEDTNSCELPNLHGLVFKEQETGYLVGYLAGLVTKSGTVSTVGGIKIPPVDHFIAGFQAGAKATNPSVKMLNGYSQDFVDQAKCKEVALDQIDQGLRRRLPGGRRLRPRRAGRREGEGHLGHRRRRRPVLRWASTS